MMIEDLGNIVGMNSIQRKADNARLLTRFWAKQL